MVAAVAFALGAATMWLFLRPHTQAPEPITSGLPNSGPPDVSRLAPADAAVALANWNYDRQNWAHAIEHYQQAIAAGRDDPDVRTDMGNCFRFLGQPEKALEQYEIAQRQNPQHEHSLFNQVSLFAEVLRDPARAAAAAREFTQRFPQSPQAEAARQHLGAPDAEREKILEWMGSRK